MLKKGNKLFETIFNLFMLPIKIEFVVSSINAFQNHSANIKQSPFISGSMHLHVFQSNNFLQLNAYTYNSQFISYDRKINVLTSSDHKMRRGRSENR